MLDAGGGPQGVGRLIMLCRRMTRSNPKQVACRMRMIRLPQSPFIRGPLWMCRKGFHSPPAKAMFREPDDALTNDATICAGIAKVFDIACPFAGHRPTYIRING